MLGGWLFFFFPKAMCIKLLFHPFPFCIPHSHNNRSKAPLVPRTRVGGGQDGTGGRRGHQAQILVQGKEPVPGLAAQLVFTPGSCLRLL